MSSGRVVFFIFPLSNKKPVLGMLQTSLLCPSSRPATGRALPDTPRLQPPPAGCAAGLQPPPLAGWGRVFSPSFALLLPLLLYYHYYYIIITIIILSLLLLLLLLF